VRRIIPATPPATGDVVTPLGRMVLCAGSAGLLAASLPGQEPDSFLRAVVATGGRSAESCRAQAHIDEAVAQMRGYFAGTRRAFELALAPPGTGFQRRVWDAVCRVPYGETRSYGAVAATLGSSLAARAVGSANGANRLPIVIPCHRLVGADGSLTGYAGGLEMKRWLLEHERRHAQRPA